MIYLTRLNNQQLIVNADLIKFIENAPDTVITLLTGDKLVVRESPAEVLERIAEFHQKFYRRVGPGIALEMSLPGHGGAKPEDTQDPPRTTQT